MITQIIYYFDYIEFWWNETRNSSSTKSIAIQKSQTPEYWYIQSLYCILGKPKKMFDFVKNISDYNQIWIKRLFGRKLIKNSKNYSKIKKKLSIRDNFSVEQNNSIGIFAKKWYSNKQK